MTLKSITPICLYDPHHLLLTNLLPLANNDTAAVIKFNLNARHEDFVTGKSARIRMYTEVNGQYSGCRIFGPPEYMRENGPMH